MVPPRRAWSVPGASSGTCPPASPLLSGRPATCLAWGMNGSCQPLGRVMEAHGRWLPKEPAQAPLIPQASSLPSPFSSHLSLCLSPDTPGHRPRLRSYPWFCCSQWAPPSRAPTLAQMTALSDLSHEHFRPLCGATGLPALSVSGHG